MSILKKGLGSILLTLLLLLSVTFSPAKASEANANADFPIQLIGTSTIDMSKADMEALLNTNNTYTDGNGNIFEGVPLRQLIAKVDDNDPVTLNNSLLGTYNIEFTGLNQDGTDYVKTAAAGSWSSYFTGGSIDTDDVFIATKVKIGGLGDFVDLPEVSVNNPAKNWRPGIVSGSLIIGSGNRIGGLYKIRLTGLPQGAPVAAFSATPTSGEAPLTVNFTDESTGTPLLTYAWDFNNDGTVDSTEQNPTYIYETAGTYTVKLTVTNAGGSDEEIKTGYIIVNISPALDVLFDGTVTLTPGRTFEVTAYNSGSVYTINENTPLGALQAAAASNVFTYEVTDKNYTASGSLLLDNVGSYLHNAPGKWYAYINDVYQDGYNNASGALNLIELVNGDKVEFYYAAGITEPTDLNAVKAVASAAVETVVSTEVNPTDWTLQLSGAKDMSITKAFFEDGLACPSSGHQVFWTDDDSNVWGGVPLWLLVGMIDDDPDEGPNHFNFNDDLAAQNYEVNVIAGDGWSATLESAAIARNNGYIVANTLNGEPLPVLTETEKPCWPLYLKGSAVFGGQQVGNIVRIELTGLPEPSEGWTLELVGDIGDTITQEEFEAGLACAGSGHYREWTDIDGNVWSGVPLWVLLGVVDDLETSNHWTFNDTVAANGYSVNVIAGDNFTKTFSSTDIARSDDFIVANKMNGAFLTDTWPLRLVGAGVTKDDGTLGGKSVGNIAKIEIPELQTPPADPGSWNLTLSGKISDVISQAEFEAGLACPVAGHLAEWTDIDGNVWSGMPLWFLTGWVDDRQPHGYNANQATAGYTVLVKAGDGYNKEFASADIAWSNDYIIANTCNGEPLTEKWPLRLVGAGVTRDDGTLSGYSVGNIAEIELTNFQTVLPVPEVHIIKYAEDRTTIINETTVNYLWMQDNLDVIGDGKIIYRYEGITNNPEDVWDAAETYPGGYKIANAVMGTRVRDLCDLVGGMGAGTEITLTATDGYETTLPYASIYTNPAVQERQGDAILAWWGDGKYMPYYADGMRLFFTPDGDNVYGQWDMHETLPPNYWHYYYSDGVQYPSCAGLSSKYITSIEIYSVPASDWTLQLDGRSIGGIYYDVSKTYFEQALACQFGSNHKVTYTDSENRVWEGMPLWFLAGFVDDADQHSNNAFNDELATKGYNVEITAANGHSITISSKDIIRNNNYIVANSLNGLTIPDSDNDWPLKLVGPSVNDAVSISQIKSIKLVNIPDNSNGGGGGGGTIINNKIAPVAAFTATPISGESPLTVNFTDASTGTTPLTYAWDFNNNGTVDSTEQNPTYQYITAGVYTVKLTVSNIAGSDEEVKAGLITVTAAETKPVILNDISSHWAKSNIEQLIALGVLNGYPDKTFKPDATITRAEFVTILVRAFTFAPQAGKVFADTANHWAKDYIATATALGIVDGYDDNNFGPNDLITREQMAVMIAKALKLDLINGETAFADKDSISEWAKGAVFTVVKNKIMQGYPDNTFRPQGNATRAEAATILVNAMDLLNK